MRRTATDLEPFRVPAFRRYLVAATITSISLWTYTTSLSRSVLGDTVGGALVAGLGSAVAMLPATVGVLAAAATIRTPPHTAGMGGGARLSRTDLSEGLRWFRGTPAHGA